MTTRQDALRSLDLPAPRLAYLSRLIDSAPTPADRQRIIDEGTREARRNSYRVRADLALIHGRNKEYEDRLKDAPRKASEPLRAPRRHAEQLPAPRPVTVTYTAPQRQEKAPPQTVEEESPQIEETAPKRTLPQGDPRHGTVGAYNNHKCRCDPCRAAKVENNRRYRASRQK